MNLIVRRWALAAAVLAAIPLAGAAGRAALRPKPGAVLLQAPDGRPLTATFADEFDRFQPLHALGDGVWRTTFGDGRVDDLDQRTIRKNGELQIYVDPTMRHAGQTVGLDPFSVSDGVLEITAKPLASDKSALLGGYGFSSGLITSQPSFSQRYGYFEMRAALPAGKGLWPAFWMLAADHSWPPEIDVVENIGDPRRAYVTAHSSAQKAEGIEVALSDNTFHTFAVAWDPQTLVWFVDGAEVGRQPTPSDMHKPMYLVANLAIGGGWAGPPNAETRWPAKLRIDYIRAYRFTRGPV
jgi:beta-glucanase (GH16 family)